MDYISLELLDDTKKEEKTCEHLSPTIECNVGGFGELRCTDPEFHGKCPYKERFIQIKNERKV